MADYPLGTIPKVLISNKLVAISIYLQGMNMELARGVAKAFLIFIVVCEMGVAWQLWRHGPPMEAVVVSDKVKEAGEVSFKMVRVPPSASDWTVLAAVIALQFALVGFLSWSRRRIARN
jgi:hypothetical protein